MCQNFATVNSTLTNLAWYGRNVTYDLLFFYSTFLSLLTSLIDFFSLLTICLSLPIGVCGNLRCVGMLGNVLGMLGNVLGRPRHGLQHPRHGLQRPRYGLQRPRHACNILGVLGMLFCKVLGVPHRRKTPSLAAL